MVVYCDLCKKNHCGKKAVMLFPEDKVKWAFMENGKIAAMLCDTHKLMFESMVRPWHVNVEFVEVKK